MCTENRYFWCGCATGMNNSTIISDGGPGLNDCQEEGLKELKFGPVEKYPGRGQGGHLLFAELLEAVETN